MFTISGLLNKKSCCFKLDTGSNVLLVSSRMVKQAGCKKIKERLTLNYPTGKEVLVIRKCVVFVELGKFFLEILMFVRRCEKIAF